MIFLTGSGFVAISIAFNAVSTHATCTVAWVVVVSFIAGPLFLIMLTAAFC